jgi:hypothetical protein
LGDDAGYRRHLTYGFYGLLVLGALVAFFVHRMAGTAIIVAAVIGLVIISVTGPQRPDSDDEP